MPLQRRLARRQRRRCGWRGRRRLRCSSSTSGRPGRRRAAADARDAGGRRRCRCRRRDRAACARRRARARGHPVGFTGRNVEGGMSVGRRGRGVRLERVLAQRGPVWGGGLGRVCHARPTRAHSAPYKLHTCVDLPACCTTHPSGGGRERHPPIVVSTPSLLFLAASVTPFQEEERGRGCVMVSRDKQTLLVGVSGVEAGAAG